MNGGEIRALAALEARVESLGERLNRAEGKRDEHFAKIYGRLDGIEAAINVSKGRASIIGGVVITIGAAVAAVIGAVATKLTGGG